ncbi:MAG: pentapeptide repeat-containing protein [Caulobacterales bacterium]
MRRDHRRRDAEGRRGAVQDREHSVRDPARAVEADRTDPPGHGQPTAHRGGGVARSRDQLGQDRRGAGGVTAIGLGALFLSTDQQPRAGATIEGRDLTDFDWADADLADAVFVDCSVQDAQMSGTVLRGVRAERCRFVRCRFSHADLREASFKDCQFADPETQHGAAFAFTRLDEAQFLRCDLTHARFEGADLYAVRMEDCNLRGAVFSRSSFARAFGPKVVRVSAALVGCNFELADLSGARLGECDLARSRFRETDLSGADLEGADLSGADLFQAIVDDLRLARADLRGAEVSGLDLRRLASHQDLKILPDQQYPLLDAMGVDVQPE